MGMHPDIGVEGLAPMNAMDQRREQFRRDGRVRHIVSARASPNTSPSRREVVVVMLDPAGYPFYLFPGNV